MSLGIFQHIRLTFSQHLKRGKKQIKIFSITELIKYFKLKSMWVFDLLTLTNHWNYLEAVQVHLSGIKSVKWQPSSNRLLKKIPQFFGSTG